MMYRSPPPVSMLGHVPSVSHKMITDALETYALPTDRVRDVDAVVACLLDPSKLDQDTWEIDWTMATAHSQFEHVVDRRFPSTRLTFTQLSAVVVDLRRLRGGDGDLFVDPVAIREAQEETVIAGVLPGSNIVRRDGTPPRRAFREAVHEFLRTRSVEGRSLLETLLSVQEHRADLGGRPLATLSRCPNPDCEAELSDESGQPFTFGREGTSCPSCAEPIYFSDVMRAHERFLEHGENKEACGRVMSVAERLLSLGFLDHAHGRFRANVGDIAFVTDGPLALFGEVAKLGRGILGRLQKVAAELRAEQLRLPVVLGVERSGVFADHARGIAQHIPTQTLMLPTDDYIERYIKSRGGRQYGSETYYGRHFFYRSRDEMVYTLTVPPLGRLGAQPTDRFDPHDYPTLAGTCALIDKIGTRLSEGTTIPLMLANLYAAYPAETAGEVLRVHVENRLSGRTGGERAL